MVRKILKYISNLPAWKTKQKLIVFLSDDWGGMRIPSIQERENLIKAGINMEGNRFNRYDCLENNKDMEALFEVLSKHKNANGKLPVLTAVSNVADPDYQQIRQSDFEIFFYKTTLDNLSERVESDRVHDLYLEGIRHKIYQPEFHGREHVEIKFWLETLKAGNEKIIEAFNNRFFFVEPSEISQVSQRAFDGAYNLSLIDELKEHQEKTVNGLDIFKEIYGYQANSFTPPSTFYNSQLDVTLQKGGIKMIDIPRLRKEPLGGAKYRRKFHYTGQKNKFGQYYLVRNAVFEPNQNENSNDVDSCLAAIEMAFKNSQPAIISNHRAAFVGGIDEKNREKGLKALDELILKIFTKWPEAEFISPNQLVELMVKKAKK